MPKFTLIAEHKDLCGREISKTTHEFEVDYIGDVLENVELFLRGVGFNQNGTLDYVIDEFEGGGHDGMGSTMENYPELNKSKYYFDTERNK